MSEANRLRNLFLCLLVLLCLVTAARALQTTDAGEAARLAASANDNATTLEERQAALTKLEAAVPLFVGAGEMIDAARVLYRVGRLQLVLNDPNAARDSHTKALKILKDTSSNETRVDNLNGLAAAHLRLQELDIAEPLLREALDLGQRSRYTAGQAQALLTLSALQNYSNHVVALQTAQQALTLWQALNDKPKLALTYALVGQCYMAQNLLSESTQNYQTALQLSQELDDKAGQAGALIAMGFIEYRKGSWQNAIAYHSRAQELVDEKNEPKRMGQAAAGMAEAFNESGLPEAGLVHFERAEGYYRQIEDPGFVAYAIFGLGRSHYLLGNYTEAANQFNRALNEVSDDSLQAAQCHENLGRVYIATREYAVALQHLQSALATYTRTINPMEAAQTQGLIAEIYQQQGQTTPARQNYQRSLQTFVRLSDRLNQSAIYYALGRLELKQNNLHLAEDYLRRSIEVTEEIRRVSNSSDLAAAFSATVHERYQSFVECLMRKHKERPDQGFATLALETSELARARSLSEMLRSTETGFAPGVDPHLAAQERSLRQSLRAMENGKVVLLAQNKLKELALLEADLGRLEQEYKQVTGIIQTRYPAFEKLTRSGAWTLQQIQTQVIADDQTLLLEYALGTDKSYVWAVTREGLTSYELPPEKEINTAAQKVYELLAVKPKAETENELNLASRELSAMILTPVAAQLNITRIIVIADGALNYIPFQFLPSPSAMGEQLVAKYEVINAPSASVLGQLRQETLRRPTAANVLAAFGDPVFASNFKQQADKETDQLAAVQTGNGQNPTRDIQPTGDSFDPATIEQLFFSKVELSNLRDVAGDKTLLATGFNATTDKLRNTDLTQYSILHLATHGILDPKRPEKSGLILSTVNSKGEAQNGFVSLQDIYALKAPLDLVVLSACRTGLGKDLRGEGLIGLTRGFIYAGASSVVASLWKVDDEATAELMKRFYTNMLEGGMRPAEALRAAQNSIRQEPRWHSPYYWAAFTLQGDYLHAVKAQPLTTYQIYQKRIVAAVVVGCLALLAIWAWWYFRRRPRSYSKSKR